MRVHELSKELGIQSKELMNFLVKLGANVRNHMSTIEDQYVEQVRQAFPTAQKQPRIPQLKSSTQVKPSVSIKPATPADISKPVVDIPKVLSKKELLIPKPSIKEPNIDKPAVQAGETVKPAQMKVEQPVFHPKNQEQPNLQKQNLEKQHLHKSNEAGMVSDTNDRPKIGVPQKPVTSHKSPVKTENRQNEQVKQGAPVKAPVHGGVKRQGQNQQQLINNLQSGQKQQQFAEPQGLKGVSAKLVPQGQQKSGLKAGYTPSRVDAQKGRPQPVQPRFGLDVRDQVAKGARTDHKNNKTGPGQISPFQRPQAKPSTSGTNVKSVQLPEYMSVKDFSQLIEVAAGDVIKKLIGLGVMATINQEIDRDTMILIADEYNITATAALSEEQKLQVEEVEDDPESLQPRPPVVTIMGHVDHGKTSLLDAIRETNVTSQEAGGITQHIGAYQVEINDRKITFLDTPGHEAFTAMRARGAQATDIAVLVVAADDGVMPQTIEAINHAKDANVIIIVAINKMDKPGANPDRIKQDLTEYGLVSGEWGGDTIFVPVSAKKRTGIDTLLEMIILVADIKEYKANPNRPAKGTIIEAKLDKGRGPVATVLVQNGTLQLGDSVIAGAAAGRVRALINDKGKRVKKAGPSMPVEMIGFTELPDAGDILYVITEDRLARELADKRVQYKRESELRKNQKITLDDLFVKIKEGEVKELKIILKADVQGSIEAIQQSLERLSNEQVRVKVIHSGVGGISEGDVMFASASNAIIIGFNVRPDPIAKRTAEKESVDIRLYRIIYNIIEDVQKAMEGMLTPEYREVINGRAEIRLVYKISKVGNIAGCYVSDGKINRNSDVRLIRNNIVIHEGKIFSLKRFKEDVREVAEGFECGISLENYNDIKEGDILEAFSLEEIKRTGMK